MNRSQLAVLNRSQFTVLQHWVHKELTVITNYHVSVMLTDIGFQTVELR